MAKIPLAVRYRPKSLEDLIGQEVITRTITNAFNSDNLHHAYIFDGTHGTGKTSLSRILAAMENCEKGPSLTPCGECNNCKEIFTGKSLDVKEIDAASNRGIDDIRDLKKEIMYSPIQCNTKYVILDESHSLTSAAAESLLKSIEEPPPNVRFILCTTEAHALKPTIHSRCIVFQFTKVSWSEIYDHISKIAHLENVSFEDNALKFIAKKSKGSVRDSLQLLQTTIDFCGESKITLELAQKALGVIDDSVYFTLIDNIMELNVPEAMLTINKLMVCGRNAEQIIRGLLEHLRNLMTINACRQNVSGLGFTEDEIKRYAHQGKSARPILVSEMMSLIIDVQTAISLNLEPHYYLEKFVVDSIVKKAKSNTKESSKKET